MLNFLLTPLIRLCAGRSLMGLIVFFCISEVPLFRLSRLNMTRVGHEVIMSALLGFYCGAIVIEKMVETKIDSTVF
jgi:hypothetical protein